MKLSGENSFLLLSMPQLEDIHFWRSVVFILHHSKEGAMGFAINQSTQVSLADFAHTHQLLCEEVHKTNPVFKGGPVELERGWVIHNDLNIEESQPIFDGIALSGSLSVLQKMMSNPYSHFRLVLGYSGWGAGQLEFELQQGNWLMLPAKKKYFLQSPAAGLWEEILAEHHIDPKQLFVGKGYH